MKYEYDVALSYKSEIVDKVKRIADYLTVDGWNVFFAPYKQHEMLSKDIHTTLYDVFKNRARFRILFISDSYVDSDWTALEMRVSLNSTDCEERALIINLAKNIELPVQYQNILYLEAKNKTEDEIAMFISEHMEKMVNGKNTSEKIQEDRINIGRKNSGETIRVNINKGIIAGDNATFGNITF